MSPDAAGPVLLRTLGRSFAARSPLVGTEDQRPLLTNSENGRLGRKFCASKVSGVFVVDTVVTIYKNSRKPGPIDGPGPRRATRTGCARARRESVCFRAGDPKGPNPSTTVSIILHVEK